jgi:NADPH:quinone reductase-like Zn-dependent oxidoreductase
MSFADQAALPLGGLNALHFMRLAKIKSDQRVAINVAGGSIGSYAVLVAKSMGADVTAVDSAVKEAGLRTFGADHFVDYARDDLTAGGRTYDVIFEIVPGSSYSACINALRPHGRYLAGNARLSTMLRCVWMTRFTDKTCRVAPAREMTEALLVLKEMVEDEKIGSIVDAVYPMPQAAAAHRRVDIEQRVGRS